MGRPDTTLQSVDSQLAGWDAVVDDNLDKVRELTFLKPYPMPLAHKTVADSGSVALSTYAASDYKWCQVLIVDAATPATNGYIAFSDGTNWKYVKTMTNV